MLLTKLGVLYFPEWHEMTCWDEGLPALKIKNSNYEVAAKYLVEYHGFEREKDEFDRDIFIVG